MMKILGDDVREFNNHHACKMAEQYLKDKPKEDLVQKLHEAVNQITSEKLSLYYDANPKEAKILERINFAFKRELLQKARENIKEKLF